MSKLIGSIVLNNRFAYLAVFLIAALAALLRHGTTSQMGQKATSSVFPGVADNLDRQSVVDYIMKAHGWEKGRYCIRQKPNNGPSLVFFVSPINEGRIPVPGGRDSLEVLVDRVTHKVTGEFHLE